MTVSNQQKLQDILSDSPLPADDYQHHTHLSPKKLSSTSTSIESFNNLVEQYTEASKGARTRKDHLESFSMHWRYVLLSFSRILYQRHWLCVSLTEREYSKVKGDYWLNKYKLQYSAVSDIVKFLIASDLVVHKEGKAYEGTPMRTRLYPNAKLAADLWQYFLDIEEDIEPPYVYVNNGEMPWQVVINNALAKDHPDKVQMNMINEFLKPHHWACKASVRLVYNKDAFHGGRLITPFQNLPDRSYRIRINTLIDGKPIAEVDFNANHLRLALAILNNQYAGETPYEDIGEASGIDDRSQIKMFITVAMGAKNSTEAMHACNKKGIHPAIFAKLTDGTRKVFPKLPLFESWGVLAQNMEGSILKQVLLDGVAKGIVCLPVHDAIAIPIGNESWALDAMSNAWSEQCYGVKTRLKIDKP